MNSKLEKKAAPRRAWLAVLVAAFVGAPALAQDAQALYVKSLAATCANCHGTFGRGIDTGEVPALAGMPATYMVAQMQAFKKGERPATVMHQLAKGYSDEQIQQIAAYFAAQKK